MNLVSLAMIVSFPFQILAYPENWQRRAYDLAKREHYQEALQIYRYLFSLGFYAPELEYNLGICALACEDLGAAIYHLRRAIDQYPWNQYFRHALQKARSVVINPPRAPLDWSRPISVAHFLAMIIWSFGWCALVALHFQGGRRLAVMGLIACASALAIFTFATYIKFREIGFTWAVVRTRCEARLGNGTSYPIATQEGQPVILYPGWEIYVVGQRPNRWFLVAVNGKPLGWVPQDCLYISILPPEWH
ncbi:MAG: tetratricopeptide repeat protein [Gemmatales bacterium]|nr:tetratricopeptide repeat protein [Gemmatales bacterium]MDW7995499.1 tetratricopeptide repeat protein [Gemmatales bacterium]